MKKNYDIDPFGEENWNEEYNNTIRIRNKMKKFFLEKYGVEDILRTEFKNGRRLMRKIKI